MTIARLNGPVRNAVIRMPGATALQHANAPMPLGGVRVRTPLAVAMTDSTDVMNAVTTVAMSAEMNAVLAHMVTPAQANALLVPLHARRVMTVPTLPHARRARHPWSASRITMAACACPS